MRGEREQFRRYAHKANPISVVHIKVRRETITESEFIPVIFVPLHDRYQYNITVELGYWAHLDELAQVSGILNAEVLDKVQAVLLDRAYTACPTGVCEVRSMAPRNPAYLLQNMGSGFAVRRTVFRQAWSTVNGGCKLCRPRGTYVSQTT